MDERLPRPDVVEDDLVLTAVVYVLPDLRGRGLGEALVREAVDGSSFAGVRWLLHTRDAHALYAKVGFGTPSERLMER